MQNDRPFLSRVRYSVLSRDPSADYNASKMEVYAKYLTSQLWKTHGNESRLQQWTKGEIAQRRKFILERAESNIVSEHWPILNYSSTLDFETEYQRSPCSWCVFSTLTIVNRIRNKKYGDYLISYTKSGWRCDLISNVTVGCVNLDAWTWIAIQASNRNMENF